MNLYLPDDIVELIICWKEVKDLTIELARVNTIVKDYAITHKKIMTETTEIIINFQNLEAENILFNTHYILKESDILTYRYALYSFENSLKLLKILATESAKIKKTLEAATIKALRIGR